MKVLTLNSGSSSVKYQFIDTDTRQAMCVGLVERIGISGTNLTHKRSDGLRTNISDNIVDHDTAIEQILKILIHPKFGVISNLNEIEAVGHRLVHAGEKFKQSVLIDDEVLDKLYECIEYAPLHNPPNIKGIEAARAKLPGIPNVGVFDTSFHVNMPDYAYIYGIPYNYYKNHGIRRYGFHGTSHYYVANRAAEILGEDIKSLKIITCHLGNGCSITAVKGGTSIDTSMGFTPLEGLLMGTRCGDLDPGVIYTIACKEHFNLDQINTFLNKQCGIQAISGLTNDLREIETEADCGNYQALLALKVFSYRLKKYIAAYIGVMNGIDVIVFTGGIGENSATVRAMVLANMDYFGIKLDSQKNKNNHATEAFLSTDDSKVKIMAIPTNEELVIATETQRIVKGTE